LGVTKSVADGFVWIVRLSDFWYRMGDQFGRAYAESIARDHVISGLGSRTVSEALADGDDALRVWRAVCEEFEVPATNR
jgi:Protein of unknown function (DUF3046)